MLVLKRAGPVGGPGMPEWGMLPIPKRLLEAGVRDIVRISDARMSGTSYGTCVLARRPGVCGRRSPSLVRDGDQIELDVEARRLDLRVEDDELSPTARTGRVSGLDRRSAATASCSSAMSPRRTWAATSTSCAARTAWPNR